VHVIVGRGGQFSKARARSWCEPVRERSEGEDACELAGALSSSVLPAALRRTRRSAGAWGCPDIITDKREFTAAGAAPRSPHAVRPPIRASGPKQLGPHAALVSVAGRPMCLFPAARLVPLDVRSRRHLLPASCSLTRRPHTNEHPSCSQILEQMGEANTDRLSVRAGAMDMAASWLGSFRYRVSTS